MVNKIKSNKIFSLYKNLSNKYGKLTWWSHEDPFEIIVGAILVQNTNWRNAKKAIQVLKANGKFNARAITTVSMTKLIQLIKSAGLYNQKAPRLKAVCAWYKNKKHFKVLKRKRTITLRTELIAIKGIGNETADAILLYGFKRPIFVVDSYTQRLLIELKLIKKQMKYEDLQLLFHQSLPLNSRLYAHYHALIVHHSQVSKRESNAVALKDT